MKGQPPVGGEQLSLKTATFDWAWESMTCCHPATPENPSPCRPLRFPSPRTGERATPLDASPPAGEDAEVPEGFDEALEKEKPEDAARHLEHRKCVLRSYRYAG